MYHNTEKKQTNQEKLWPDLKGNLDISEWKRREKEAQKYIALMTSMCSQGIVNPPSLTQWKGQMLYYLNVESVGNGEKQNGAVWGHVAESNKCAGDWGVSMRVWADVM